MPKKILLIIPFILIILITTSFFFSPKKPLPPTPLKEEELNIFIWENYLSQKVVEEFEAKFGVKVNIDTFEDTDQMFAVLQSQPEKYDLIVAEDDLVVLMKNLKLLSPLDHSMIPNLIYLKEEAKQNQYDFGNVFCLPYVAGFTGIAINEKYVKDFDQTRKILWDENYKGRISMPNNLEEVLTNALFYLGYPINTPTKEQLAKAIELALQQKDLIIGYDDPITQRNLMINEEAWIAYIYSTEVFPIQKANPNVKFFALKEGVLLWADNWCIPKDAPHKHLAHQFLNYLLDPKVSAQNSEEIGALMVNEAAKNFISPEIKKSLEGLDFPREREILFKSQYFLASTDPTIREAINLLESELFSSAP